MTAGTRSASATSGLADVEIQLASDDLRCPPSQRLVEWVHAVLGPRPDSQLTLRIVGDAESAELNQRYRGRAGATNVLSFGAAKDWPAIEGEPMPVGDLVVCAPVLEREAAEQGKTLEAHWAHIVVHGVLHLLGYDHEADDDALAMEAEERRLLARLGVPDPYADDEEHAR